MQLVETAHNAQVPGRYRSGSVIDAAPADVQNLGLLSDGQSVRAVNQRFALSGPAFLSAPSKKPFSSVSSPILACSAFKSSGTAPAPRRAGAEDLRRAIEQLGFPGRDLVRMDIKYPRQFGQRLLAL
jgi:hypothetical protein